MCGIVGTLVFDRSAFRISPSYLSGMRDAMRHRGPDGEGLYLAPDGRMGLGHRRLSIIDLSSAASQPMANEDHTLWVVFNGEIYNHADLRAELEQKGGHVWQTDHSDTEVLLHGFEEWGIDFVSRLRGMFAFALWDGRRRELWLVRDRIGIKPLYYSAHHGRLTFASEIKALLQDPQQERRVNEKSLFDYFSFLSSPAPETLFDGIYKLPAGHWMRVRPDGSMTCRRYWDILERAAEPLDRPDDQLVEQLRQELRTAVRLHKVSDVPMGVFLSGGVDSSLNAALFSEGESSPIHTFTIGYKGQHRSYGDETPHARQMAEHIGSRHHELLLDADDLVSFLPRMIEMQDEPLGDPVCVPVYYVSKLAREQGVKVCHVGEGADELFGGYESWYRMQSIQNRCDRWPRWMQQAGVQALRGVGLARTIHYEWLRRRAQGQPVFWSGVESFSRHGKFLIMSPRLRENFTPYQSWQVLGPYYRHFQQRAVDQHPLAWMTYSNLSLRLPELLLMRVDKMAMSVGLETRVPFLDHEVVELACRIPMQRRSDGQHPKRLLKQAARGLVPDNLLDRRKQGFGVPMHEWFVQRLRRLIRDELDVFLKETDFFDAREITRLLERGHHDRSWYVLNFVLWWNRYIRGTP
jgi:asparagine synthase (glutamine-hydrolysing)